jgi:hypothetical protein
VVQSDSEDTFLHKRRNTCFIALFLDVKDFDLCGVPLLVVRIRVSPCPRFLWHLDARKKGRTISESVRKALIECMPIKLTWRVRSTGPNTANWQDYSVYIVIHYMGMRLPFLIPASDSNFLTEMKHDCISIT